METAFQFPAAAPDDPSDVALAVQTAGALWRQGDSREALKWLRRAAETAETEGDDMRALTLARAAAELKDRLPHLTSVPPPPAGSVAPPPVAAASAPPPMRVSAPPSIAPAQAPPSNAPRSQIPPAPPLVSSLTTDLGLGPEKLEAWSPPSSRAPAETPAPAPMSAAAPATVASGVPPAPALAPEPVAVVAPALAAVPVEEPQTPVAPPISASVTDARVALRVSVAVLSKGSGSLLVRVLEEGEELPPGAREALLVPLDAGVDLRHP